MLAAWYRPASIVVVFVLPLVTVIDVPVVDYPVIVGFTGSFGDICVPVGAMTITMYVPGSTVKL
jgi:hypothetical protein